MKAKLNIAISENEVHAPTNSLFKHVSVNTNKIQHFARHLLTWSLPCIKMRLPGGSICEKPMSYLTAILIEIKEGNSHNNHKQKENHKTKPKQI
jgi:hypothetical protein